MTDKIAIIGLGYVGLPLAIEFSKKFDVIGFDINESRVNELVSGFDRTLEVEARDLEQSKKLTFTSLPADICKVKNTMSFSNLMNSKDKFVLVGLAKFCKIVMSIYK